MTDEQTVLRHCCNTPIADRHIPGCAYEPRDTSQPPPAPNPPPEAAPAAAPPVYGFKKANEEDLELPSGGLVRIRKLNMNHVFSLRITELRDVFTADLVSDAQEPVIDEDAAQKSFEEALLDPERSAKLLDPVNRVVVAAVLCPTVVTDEPSDDDQIHVDDIDVLDKFVIFSAAVGDQLAAFGGQQEALKSVQPGQEAGVRDLPASNDIQPAPQ